MKLILKATKPRNPMVAPALRRSAGAHRSGCQRQQGQRALRRELQDLRPSP